MDERTQANYLDLGIEYLYVARLLALQNIQPSSGFMFHLAIEFLFKGLLLSKFSSAELKEKSHNLTELFEEVKKLCNSEELSRFDSEIKNLDEFENIRYPDRYDMDATSFSVSLGAVNGLAAALAPNTKNYRIDISIIDNLIVSLSKCYGPRMADYFKELRKKLWNGEMAIPEIYTK